MPCQVQQVFSEQLLSFYFQLNRITVPVLRPYPSEKTRSVYTQDTRFGRQPQVGRRAELCSPRNLEVECGICGCSPHLYTGSRSWMRKGPAKQNFLIHAASRDFPCCCFLSPLLPWGGLNLKIFSLNQAVLQRGLVFTSSWAAVFVPGSVDSPSRNGRAQWETLWPKWILSKGLGHNGLLNLPSPFGRSPFGSRLGGARLYLMKQGSLSLQIFLCRHI